MDQDANWRRNKKAHCVIACHLNLLFVDHILRCGADLGVPGNPHGKPRDMQVKDNQSLGVWMNDEQCYIWAGIA